MRLSTTALQKSLLLAPGMPHLLTILLIVFCTTFKFRFLCFGCVVRFKLREFEFWAAACSRSTMAFDFEIRVVLW